MSRRSLFAAALSLAYLAPHALAHDGHLHAPAPSGPAANYAFPLPEPGSYRLPAIKPAPGGSVLDETGAPHDLRDLVAGKVTMLAFVYTRCADICPIATARLQQLFELAGEDAALASRLRLVSMSFDPQHDTAEVMAEQAELWRGPARTAPEWLFLTAPDEAALQPILTGYNQAVVKADPADPAGALGHVLRVFLIDEVGTIRNIYSLDFLDPHLVFGDIRTLLMEGGS
ncbi:MAG TPA: SCO family protein [Afifellaceae bacterium]|nr:SCO family protein [Afifellaceae bacterium]